MRTKRVELCRPGNVLWADVCFKSGNILYKKGTVLTSYDIDAIQNAGVKDIAICSKENEIRSISRFDLRHTSTITHNMSLVSAIVTEIDNGIKYGVFGYICGELLRHQYNVAILTALVLNETTNLIGSSKQIILGALLHDIGKTVLPDDVLYSNRKLTVDERKIISEHPTIGYDILNSLRFSDTVCLIAKQHQECSDGSGYPDKLTDEQISYGAKLVHIADVYEAMCAARCYRGPMERTRVRSVMMYESHKYNKDLLETFMEEVPLYMLNDVICYKDRIYKVVGYTETKYPLVVDIFTNKEYDLSEFNPAFIEPVDLILKVGDET